MKHTTPPLHPLLIHSITIDTFVIHSYNRAYTLQHFETGPKLEYLNRRSLKKYNLVYFRPFNSLNDELNPIRHLLALVGARHTVHVSRIRVNPLNAELNPIRHLLALVGARHIVHVSRVRVKHDRRHEWVFRTSFILDVRSHFSCTAHELPQRISEQIVTEI